MNFSSSLYNASYKALTQNRVPVSIAHQASLIVASDTVPPSRSPEQQRIIQDAMTWMFAERREVNE